MKNRITYAETFLDREEQRRYEIIWSGWIHKFYCQGANGENYSFANAYNLSWKRKDDLEGRNKFPEGKSPEPWRVLLRP